MSAGKSSCHNVDLGLEPVWLIRARKPPFSGNGRVRIGEVPTCGYWSCHKIAGSFRPNLGRPGQVGELCPTEIGSKEWAAMVATTKTGPFYFEQRGGSYFPEGFVDRSAPVAPVTPPRPIERERTEAKESPALEEEVYEGPEPE